MTAREPMIKEYLILFVRAGCDSDFPQYLNELLLQLGTKTTVLALLLGLHRGEAGTRLLDI